VNTTVAPIQSGLMDNLGLADLKKLKLA